MNVPRALEMPGGLDWWKCRVGQRNRLDVIFLAGREALLHRLNLGEKLRLFGKRALL